MTLEEKYSKYKEIYQKYFIFEGDSKEEATNIPLESVTFDEEGKAIYSESGDGPINIAYYLTYLYLNLCIDEEATKAKEQILNVLSTLDRLEEKAFLSFCESYSIALNENICLPFGKIPGFFLRDDISHKKNYLFNTKSVNSSYSKCIELINEDPCHSPYVSQDQIWNLIPILYRLANNGLYSNIANQAKKKASDIIGYLVLHNYTLYNPFYSALYHFWTFLPSFDEKKVPPTSRVTNRLSNFKYKIKVKRGANSWYFAWGFKKAYEQITGDKLGKDFWLRIWYKPFVFLADRVYYPLFSKFVKRKETSYYSLGSVGAWYSKRYDKRLIKRFNKSLEKGDLFMPQLVVFSKENSNIDKDLLYKWLENYPEPNLSGKMESPIFYLILYTWIKIV